jgi:hypothetical protein
MKPAFVSIDWLYGVHFNKLQVHGSGFPPVEVQQADECLGWMLSFISVSLVVSLSSVSL